MTKDYAEAARWLKHAAEQGKAAAQNSLGVMCENGLGMEPSIAEAVTWFRAAAERGEPRGQMNLGRMYDKGTGVEADAVLACMWLTLSKDQDEATGRNYLKDLLINGRATQRQLAEGIERAKAFVAKR